MWNVEGGRGKTRPDTDFGQFCAFLGCFGRILTVLGRFWAILGDFGRFLGANSHTDGHGRTPTDIPRGRDRRMLRTPLARRKQVAEA
jgi:hypothetical protein